MNRPSRNKRSIRSRILIMCEGETEKNYFQAIKEDPDYKQKLSAVNPQIVTAKNSTPEQLVKEAVKRGNKEKKSGNPYDKIWVVFDHDHHPSRKFAYQDANKQGFEVAFSSIAFEEWFLLHFVKSAKAFVNEMGLEKELQKHYKNYEKAKQNDFANLKDKLLIALENAEWLRNQIFKEDQHITDFLVWTDVDILVKVLISDIP